MFRKIILFLKVIYSFIIFVNVFFVFYRGVFMKKFLLKMGITVPILILGLVFSSCSNKITEEQLMQLRELRKQERSLNEAINKKKDNKMKLERELNSRRAELRDCQEKTQFVKDKLAKWPDVWPDWKPEQQETIQQEGIQPNKEAPKKKIQVK